MGSNTIPSATDGTVIPSSHHNSVKEAMANDLVPRNTSGVATANQGSVGTDALPFKNARISAGYFFPGQLIAMHTYNSLLSPGQGWMKCDGRVINQTNYDAEHGAGSWTSLIGSSLLDGKYLPNMTGNKYLAGVSATTQPGTSAITEIGNSNNQINIAHSHTVPTHNHKWYDYQGANHDNVFNSSGSLITVPTSAPSNNHITFNQPSTGGITNAKAPNQDMHTDNQGGSTNSQLSAAQTIQPRSVEVIYYMRIVT